MKKARQTKQTNGAARHGLVGRCFDIFPEVDGTVLEGYVDADLGNGFYVVAITTDSEGFQRVVHIEEMAKPTWLFYDDAKHREAARKVRELGEQHT